MKKQILFLISLLVFSQFTQAQLVVDSLGNTAVGYDGTDNVLSDFAVNGRGQSTASAYIDADGKTYGLYVKESSSTEPARSAPSRYGIYSQTDPSSTGYYYSIYGKFKSLCRYS